MVISSVTLDELEKIKTNCNKDISIKVAARHISDFIWEHGDLFTIHIFKESMLKPIIDADLTVTNDLKILATAIDYKQKHQNGIFITNDKLLTAFAYSFFPKEEVDYVKPEKDEYTGYIDIQLSNEQLEYFYSNLTENQFNSYINQYLIIRDSTGYIIDKRVWTGTEYRILNFQNLNSQQLGNIKPIDALQQCVADSLCHNKITLIKGPAGSGKSLLSMGFLFNQLERHRIDKIIIFCNTIAAKGAAKLGFYPGSREEKLMDSQIGNFLISKLGDKIEVERLINENKLLLLPMADIRGFDTTNMNAGIYITEAQNLDIPLMKLALQRIDNNSICIIDGDEKTQVDDINFAGVNNGMRRASKVFRGHNIYGEIELKKIYRSDIAEIAEEM